jgi:AraC-like DNA-binding protein
MNLNLHAFDLFLRGAAASLLLFHMAHALSSRLPPLRRGLLAAFEASILAYLLCSDPAIRVAPTAVWLVALSLCLMAAPLLWLVVALVFDDGFRWTPAKTLCLAAALVMGWLAVMNVGGVVVGAAHKVMLIGFAAATLWAVVKDWQSDLVAHRRLLRSWVTGGLAAYVLLVVSLELVFIRSAAPPWLMVLHLAGITGVAGLTALVFARHPLDEWFRPAVVVPARAPVGASPSLTPAPPALDRKAALRVRLLQAMASGRAYAQEGLSLPQLAVRLDATPAQLRETINQDLGYRNFNDFLHHYRIDEAAQRLLAQDLPILSIALDVGYGSIGPFNRAFRQIKGVTPSEFRTQKP